LGPPPSPIGHGRGEAATCLHAMLCYNTQHGERSAAGFAWGQRGAGAIFARLSIFEMRARGFWAALHGADSVEYLVAGYMEL
jgi:hypothetical protein